MAGKTAGSLSGADSGRARLDRHVTAADQTTPATRRDDDHRRAWAACCLQRVVLPSYRVPAPLPRRPRCSAHARRCSAPELFEQVAPGRARHREWHPPAEHRRSSLVKIAPSHRPRSRPSSPPTTSSTTASGAGTPAARPRAGVHAAWDLLRDVGVLSADLPLRRTVGAGTALDRGQMVDRYRIHSAPGPRMSASATSTNAARAWTTARLQGLASRLVGTFWADIETPPPRHRHPAPARGGGRGMEATDQRSSPRDGKDRRSPPDTGSPC